MTNPRVEWLRQHRIEQGDRCHYCGVRFTERGIDACFAATMDHVVPLVAGGDHAFEDTLADIDRRYGQMRGSHRGSFLVLRGDSGAGKSTFLHTVGRFRKGVKSEAVPGSVDIRKYFSDARATGSMTIGSNLRLEIMWRKKTSRADIANYTLTKLANYGKALGYLQ